MRENACKDARLLNLPRTRVVVEERSGAGQRGHIAADINLGDVHLDAERRDLVELLFDAIHVSAEQRGADDALGVVDVGDVELARTVCEQKGTTQCQANECAAEGCAAAASRCCDVKETEQLTWKPTASIGTPRRSANLT